MDYTFCSSMNFRVVLVAMEVNFVLGVMFDLRMKEPAARLGTMTMICFAR